MQTKLLAGQYLVNGTKCELSIHPDSICWYPIRKFSKYKSNSTTSSTKTTSNDGAVEAESKRILLKQVIGIKNFYLTSVAKLQKSNKYNKKKEDKEESTISKVKVYYVIQNENKSASRLLKLKKLSIESVTNRTTSTPKNGKLQNSSPILLDHQQNQGNNLLSSFASKGEEKLHKQSSSSATSCGVDQNSTIKEDICDSAPPSCYASEGSTGYLSNLSISSSTNCDNIAGISNTKLVQNLREDSNTINSDSSSSCITKTTTTQVPKQNNSEQISTSSSYSSSSSTSSSLLSNKLVADLAKLSSLIEELLEIQRKQRPKRLLIFVNPFGGKGKALNLFKLQVRRLLDLARIESELIVTRHANHARDTIEDPQFNIEYFEGIICVGGDGMFSELMNGLIYRYNRDRILTAAISGNGFDDSVINDDNYKGEFEQERARTKEPTIMTTSTMTNKISEKFLKEQRLNNLRKALGGIGKPFLSPPIPIGVIGAGSTDANSFGILGTNDVITATLNIILGNQINIDVCSVHSYERDNLLRFVSTFVGYGYFGDVIRESEKLRWLGPSRYDITGVNNLIKNRTYKGQVNILSCSKDGTPFNHNRCHANCEFCGLNQTTSNNSSRLNDSEYDHDETVSNLECSEKSGHFVGVNAAVTACRCPQTKKGFSPNNHLANGCADLILVRPCSRMQYIQYLLRTGWTKKSVFDLKYVEAYRCRQFEFIAQGESSRSRFDVVVDGDDDEFSQYNKQNHKQLILSASVATTMTKSSSSSSSSTSSSGVDIGQSSSSKSNSLESRQSSNSQSSNSKVRFETNAVSSWNIDGEILNEQSIRVKVNNQLLRVFGTGEPKQ